MNKRLSVFIAVGGVCLGSLTGCSSGPMRGNSAGYLDATGTAASAGLGATGAANSPGSAAGPGTSTGLSRGGGR